MICVHYFTEREMADRAAGICPLCLQAELDDVRAELNACVKRAMKEADEVKVLRAERDAANRALFQAQEAANRALFQAQEAANRALFQAQEAAKSLRAELSDANLKLEAADMQANRMYAALEALSGGELLEIPGSWCSGFRAALDKVRASINGSPDNYLDHCLRVARNREDVAMAKRDALENALRFAASWIESGRSIDGLSERMREAIDAARKEGK
jgi:hypothetical protein